MARPVSVMDVHGINDRTCPANWTEPSDDGWYYEMVPVMNDLWAQADGCTPALAHYPTSFDHGNGLYCVQQGDCPAGVDVVRCAWQGGHGMYGNLAGLMWEFMAAHPMQATSSSAAPTDAPGRGSSGVLEREDNRLRAPFNEGRH